MFGVIIESVLCGISVVSVLSGGFGPCGPTGDVSGFVRVIRQPGFWLSGCLVEDSSPMYLVLSVAATTMMLSILAYIILRVVHKRNRKLSRNVLSVLSINMALPVELAMERGGGLGDFQFSYCVRVGFGGLYVYPSAHLSGANLLSPLSLL